MPSLTMQAISFELDGPLVGAVRTTQRAKYVCPAYRRYAAFKTRIRIAATLAGIVPSLNPTDAIAVSIAVSWRKRQRADLDNVIKAILDGLWRNDRRVIQIDAIAHENTGHESVRIEVKHLDG